MTELREKLSEISRVLPLDLHYAAAARKTYDLLTVIVERIEKMEKTEIRNAIEEKLQGKRARFHGELAGTAGAPYEILLDAMAAVFADGKLDKNDEQYVTEAMQELFDQYVVPWNNPAIPDAIEPITERITRSLIPTAVGLAFSMIPESGEQKFGQ